MPYKNISKVFRKSSAPHNLFKKLQNNWKELNIDQTKLLKYQYGGVDFRDQQATKSLESCNKIFKKLNIPSCCILLKS